MRLTRRSLVLSLPAAALLLGCAAGGDGAPDRPAVQPRSFLLVTLDTTRADRLEPYGAAVETPTLGELARQGALFERAFATTPVTLPSHASMFTGLYPPAHGVRQNGLHRLPADLPTLAGLLRDAGFRTGAFVSSAVLDRRFGLARGFEHYDDDMAGGTPRSPGFHPERSAGRTVDAARDWLDRLEAGERFFQWVHLFDPHAVFEPPPPFAERYRERPYDGEIAYMDSELGRLLEQPRLADRQEILIMVIADHGESLGEHGEANHGLLAYDATMRVPWVVRGPGVGAGRRLTVPASQVDLLPTALELLGLGSLADELTHQGRSHAARLLAATGPDETASAPDRSLYGETLMPLHTYGWAPLQVARRGDWKLIQGPEPELFNLAEDPGETRDLADRQPQQVRSLQRELHRLAGADRRPVETVSSDAEMEDQLRSLGYLASQTPSARTSPRPDPRKMIDLHRLMGTAGQLLSRGELDPAVEILGEVLDRDPGNPAAVADKARALEGLGRFEEAAELLRSALRRHPDNPRLHRALAGVEAAGGRLDEAVAALDRALALEPASVEARVEKSIHLARLGRAEEASALLSNALAEDPDHARLNVAYARLVEAPAGRLDEAVARLRGVSQRDPYLAEAWISLGQLLEQRQESAAALAVYRDGQRYQPNDGLLQAHTGLLLLGRGEIADAETHLRRAERLLTPTPPDVYCGLAAVAAQRGDWVVVETAARNALERDARRADAWNYLAAAREEQDDDQGAMRAYQRALEIDPGYTPALLNRGLALRRLGRFAEAEASFLAVLDERPDDAKAHYELGVIYGGPLRRPESAQLHLRASLAAEPDHPRAPRIRALLSELGR